MRQRSSKRLSRPDYFLSNALHQMLTSTFILAFQTMPLSSLYLTFESWWTWRKYSFKKHLKRCARGRLWCRLWERRKRYNCKERTPTKTQTSWRIFYCVMPPENSRGFSERHLAHLYGVAQSTISRLFVPWINFMYLKFGQVCIWPSKLVVQATMPADFK